MAFKIKKFYGSPLHSEGFTMDELNKKTKKEQVKSKAQASKLPQIEKPGFDYEMDQDMSYPGGERGRDYDEDGLKDLKKEAPSRKASPLNDGYIKQEEKMIKRNEKKGNQYQSASAGSRNQRMQNAIGSAQAANAITQSKKTINLLKS